MTKSKKLRQFLMNSVNANELSKRNDGIWLTRRIGLDYREATHSITGNSTLMEVAAGPCTTVDWHFTINGIDRKVERKLKLAVNLFVLDFKSENEQDGGLAEKVVRDGFYFERVDPETGEIEEGHATFLSYSNAQNRTLRAVFADSIDTRNLLIRKLGLSPYLFAKSLGDGIWRMDADKWAKRFGLMQTTSHLTSLEFGSQVVALGNNEFKIVGRDKLTVYIVNDCISVIDKGYYRAFDPVSKTLKTFDASKEPYRRKVGDGMALISSRFADLCEKEGFTRNHQSRLNPANKFMAIEYDAIKEVWPDADLVMSRSCVKGVLDQFLKKHPKIKLQYRIANKTQPSQIMRNMVYQFVNSMLITPTGLMAAFAEGLESAEKALTDQETMMKLIGVYLNDLDLESKESDDNDEGELTTRTMATELQEILTLNPEAYRDLYIVEKAHSLLLKITEKWVGGTAPVRGQYKFLVDDPIAIVEAYKANVRDKNGNFLVPVSAGLAAGQCVYRNTLGEIHIDEVAVGRAPCVTYGEVQVLQAVNDPRYTDLGYDGLLVLNVKDFTLAAMGGADCDGDIALVMEHLALIAAAKATLSRLPIIDDGCPYQGDTSVDFSFEFTDAEWSSDRKMVFERMYERIRDYAARSLKANAIGLLSNRASLFLNGISDNVANANQFTDRNELIKTNRELLDKVDLLRLCTGWEIDKVKHGGAFWDALYKELAFVRKAKHAPEQLTEPCVTMYGPGKRYKEPSWFAYNRLMKASVANVYDIQKTWLSASTLDQVHAMLIEWRNGLVDRVQTKMDEMLGQSIVPNSMSSDFISAMNIKTESILHRNFDVISKKVMKAVLAWKEDRSNLTVNIGKELDKIIDPSKIKKYDHDTVRLLRKRNQLRAQLAKNYELVDEFHAGLANGLQEDIGLTDAEFAYVAYLETYRNYRAEKIDAFRELRKGAKHYKYPWIVLGDKMLSLLALTVNRNYVKGHAKSDRIIRTFNVIMPRNRMLDADGPITIKRSHGGFVVYQYDKPQGDLVVYCLPLMSGLDELIIDPIRVEFMRETIKSDQVTYKVTF